MRVPPAGVALDSGNGHVYWSNIGSGDIRRANLDGSGEKILVRSLEGPAFITLDLSPLPPLYVQATMAKSNSAFTVNWSALMGRAYRLQFKTDLNQIDWSNLILRVTATNTTMTAVDSTVTDPQRFYRVQLLP